MFLREVIMPRGRPKKVIDNVPMQNGEPIVSPAVKVAVLEKEVKHETEKEKKEELVLTSQTAVSPVPRKLEPLQPGQKYFEDPDGNILIGEADKQQLWSRTLNHGKGGWINPKR